MHILEQEKNVRMGNMKNKIMELFKERVDLIDFLSFLLFVIKVLYLCCLWASCLFGKQIQIWTSVSRKE